MSDLKEGDMVCLVNVAPETNGYAAGLRTGSAGVLVFMGLGSKCRYCHSSRCAYHVRFTDTGERVVCCLRHQLQKIDPDCRNVGSWDQCIWRPNITAVSQSR